MADYTKTANTSVIAIATLATGAVAKGTLTLTSALGALITMRMGRTSTSAFTTSGLRFRVEISAESSGDDNWIEHRTFETGAGSSIAGQAHSSGGSAGTNTVTLAAGTNFAGLDFVFFYNSGTIGNSEWARVLSVSSATLTLEDNLTNSVSGTTCYDQAESFTCYVPPETVRARVVVTNVTGQTVVIEVFASTVDAIE